MPSPTQITPAQLSRLIGTPDAPVILDVILNEDFALAPRLIPTASRQNHLTIAEQAPSLKGKKVVVVCQKGFKISQGSAAILRDHGVKAETLEGGNMGWQEAGLPTIPHAKIPEKNEEGRTVWVTRQRPKIDRIACPWLIRRFIDPMAQFLFVDASQVQNVAKNFGAIPFDIEDVPFSHKGELCTFDTLLETFELSIPALKHLAQIVRGADTGRTDLAPESAGLLAASLGLSRMFRDDLEQLEAGLTLYDAFYRWARDATSETHTWSGETMK